MAEDFGEAQKKVRKLEEAAEIAVEGIPEPTALDRQPKSGSDFETLREAHAAADRVKVAGIRTKLDGKTDIAIQNENTKLQESLSARREERETKATKKKWIQRFGLGAAAAGVTVLGVAAGWLGIKGRGAEKPTFGNKPTEISKSESRVDMNLVNKMRAGEKGTFHVVAQTEETGPGFVRSIDAMMKEAGWDPSNEVQRESFSTAVGMLNQEAYTNGTHSLTTGDKVAPLNNPDSTK